jgi:hypothetical protein
MKKILSTIIFAVALQGCSTTVNEWETGTRASGYRSYDVCIICGEQMKFIPNEEYGMSKDMKRSGFQYGPTAYIEY